MSRTVLVLTATGTTGRATVNALLRRGAQVRAATRDPQAAQLPAGVEKVAFSYDDRSTWPAAFAGVDAVYLAYPSFREDEVELGQALVQAAKAAGLKKIVKLSAIGVENNPSSGHRQVELAIEASGLDWVHLHPNFFHENLIEFYGAGIKDAGGIFLPAGDGRTSFIAAEDIGEAAAVALLGEQTGEFWTLTGPESLDHAEVAQALSATLGRTITYHDVSVDEHIQGARQLGMPELGVQTMSALYGFVRAGWVGGLSPDLERATGQRGKTLRDWVNEHRTAWL